MTAVRIPKISKSLPFIKELPFCSILSRDDQIELAECSSSFSVKAGGTFFEENSLPDGGHIVAAGKVFMRKNTHRGRSIVVELLADRDPCGLVAAAQQRKYPLTAVALRSSVIFSIPQEKLNQIVKKYPDFTDNLLKVCTERISTAFELISYLADADSEARIAHALLLFADKFGTNNGRFTTVEITRKELAAIAATTVETCIRVTRTFQNNGLLSFPASKRIELLEPARLRLLCTPN